MPAGTNPFKMFTSLVQHGWDWEADYSDGNEEEVFFWLRAEIIARVVRALHTGRPVKFFDQEFRLELGGGCDPLLTAQAIEDAIAASGRMVFILSDDEQGLVIGDAGEEM